MKPYLIGIFLFYCVWFIASAIFPDPVWWSLFSSDRTTHTPLTEQISLVKVFITSLVFMGIWALIRQRHSK
ncbi:hypothetical protein EJA10_02800 [Mesobacillus subterraneus]|uniref:Uncharacterized protein n=1 Tax=Mesobacillus subterraneus TaxID=285983 RepID=A0A427TY28_9BACI|nr:hypothetical protein EJA10_02800 [Mesobacillus subterraneus]